ncbi:MAG: tRNA-dihydrouridine synthase family protein [Faecalibacterium sp.]|jgi:tRNA-dihydrouridine synthase|nr:tRNA-dihydrouridine synthase family protein [Faecalibacterium sp.]
MLYEFAPMEGFTDSVYRRTHARFFPGDAAPDRFYTPFISPTHEHLITPRQLREILPEHNRGFALVPQLLSNSAEDFLWMCGELAGMGYREVNLNLGCPAGTVVAKSKGAGFLRDPAALDRFLDTVYAQTPVKVSIKTRLGLSDPEEFGPLLEIFNRYPVSELIIHPRVQKDIYRNEVRLPIFERALRESKAPVCYNGSLYTAAACRTFVHTHPAICGLMLGRGLIANPALLRQIRGGAPLEKATLRAFLDTLLAEYTVLFGSPQSAIRRMKGIWSYTLCLFAGHEKLERMLRRANDPWDYKTAVDCIFTQLKFLPDAVDVK